MNGYLSNAHICILGNVYISVNILGIGDIEVNKTRFYSK